MTLTISSLISSTESGDRSAADALFSALYSELHRLAQSQLARSGSGVTLGATTLLHEAYLDISQRESAVFPDRGRFMAYAAKVMRGLIIDYARERRAQKRGGGFEITSLEAAADAAADDKELDRISAALDELAAVDPALAEVGSEVLLRFLLRRDRRHARHVGTYGAAALGEGAHLSPPHTASGKLCLKPAMGMPGERKACSS